MVKPLYAVRDDKAGVYNPPVIMVNDAVAVRQFGDLVMRDDNVIHAHAADFTLRRVGSFDDETGQIRNQEPEILATGSDFVKE